MPALASMRSHCGISRDQTCMELILQRPRSSDANARIERPAVPTRYGSRFDDRIGAHPFIGGIFRPCALQVVMRMHGSKQETATCKRCDTTQYTPAPYER